MFKAKLDKAGGAEITCPNCQALHKFKDQGELKKLTKNFALISLASHQNLMVPLNQIQAMMQKKAEVKAQIQVEERKSWNVDQMNKNADPLENTEEMSMIAMDETARRFSDQSDDEEPPLNYK